MLLVFTSVGKRLLIKATADCCPINTAFSDIRGHVVHLHVKPLEVGLSQECERMYLQSGNMFTHSVNV